MLFKGKNNLMVLGAGLLVALFIMGMVLYSRGNRKSQNELIYQNVTAQSRSTEINAIEKDLLETEIEQIDRELQQIENELESAY